MRGPEEFGSDEARKAKAAADEAAAEADRSVRVMICVNRIELGGKFRGSSST